MLKKTLISAALALPLALAALGSEPASATLYTFTSDGTFSNCGNCTTSNTNHQINWGSSPQSTMFTDSNFNGDSHSGSTVSNPKQIGQIDWTNRENNESSNPVTSTYTIALNFSSPPPGGSGSLLLPVSITNTPNNALVCFFIFCSHTGDVDDTATIPDGGSLTIDGLTLSNISFVVTSGGSFDTTTNTWSNPEGNTSNLEIFATIADAAVQQTVPEPSSLAIFGSVLAGLGLLRGRRHRRNTAV